MTIADRGMAVGLRALRVAAGSPALDRLGLREQAEKAVFQLTKQGFKSAGTAGRTFQRVAGSGKPARQRPTTATGLFDLTPTDEQEMVVESLKAFATERLRPIAADADAAATAPDTLPAEAAELGVALLGVPEEAGGAMSERSSVTGVLAAEALAHGDMGLALSLLAPAGVATALARFGDATQQATYLPAFTGDDVAPAAVAILEPGPLPDPFALRTTAKDAGSGWVLDGEKALVPLAASADLLLVAAQTPTGPAVFVVEPGAASGLTVEPEPAMGVRAASTGRVRLDGVHVGADALLCDGAGYAELVRRARLGWCALSLGTARAVLDYVIPYVNEREAFGEPISNRQSVAFAVSDIAIELEGMRLATLRAASLVDREADAAQAIAIARRLCTDKGMAIGSQGVQLLGGHGYIKEHPVERWYRDLRACGVMEGALVV
ncbi:acyl-CoA dehydrogenase family protein [Conexibacter sp. SYSU D00693]|uniref:acyl-CoA dehydrogenase family protein n=1 Tax=Conexibacter sp. SYSU D00693 TaxID=2812560 RepID=UPI001F11DEC9|nr:acyl-CoA dehydrogenase family protein [Conexibacter sp. SYSU D00693]